ncbi:unnamed protein product, partial [Rotaria magnacalcarata]
LVLALHQPPQQQHQQLQQQRQQLHHLVIVETIPLSHDSKHISESYDLVSKCTIF